MKSPPQILIAFCGRADPVIQATGYFDRIVELRATGLPETELMARAADLLADAAACVDAPEVEIVLPPG